MADGGACHADTFKLGHDPAWHGRRRARRVTARDAAPRAGRRVAVAQRMLLFRSIALGLLGACFVLLATRPLYEVRLVRSPPRVLPPAASIVDVAAVVAPSAIGSLVRLAPGERVVAVDDHPVYDPIDAALRLQRRAPHAGEYVDLTVAGPADTRRVLVLLH